MNNTTTINNNGHFNGGYFILNEKRTNNKWIERNNLFVTLSNHNSIKREIIELIRCSKSSIKLCSFILTDKEIYYEIEKVLENKNVAIFILTQLDSTKFSTSLLSDEEMIDNFSQIHLDIIKKLYSRGAHVRATNSAHAKFVISDRKKALLTSANITTPSLNSNPETGVYLSEMESVIHLDKLFDEIFKKGTEYTRFISASKNKQFIVSRKSKISGDEELFNLESKLKYTFEDYNLSLYNELVSIIENTSGDIILSTYSIVGLYALPELVNAIHNKIKKGKSITIFSRGMNYRTDHLDSCTQLARMGCKIYGDVFNHSKAIITPEKGMIFTANIDGNHGLKKGFEVGLNIDNDQKNDVKAFLDWQVETAPYIFKLSPQKKEYFDYYDYYCIEKDIQPKINNIDIEIKLDVSNAKLSKIINEKPCFYKIKNKKISQLQIGNYSYEASFDNNIMTVGNQIYKREYNLESYLLKYKKIKITVG